MKTTPLPLSCDGLNSVYGTVTLPIPSFCTSPATGNMSGYGLFYGFVYDINGDPLSGVTVSSDIKSTVTASDGTWVMGHNAGSYTVSISNPSGINSVSNVPVYDAQGTYCEMRVSE